MKKLPIEATVAAAYKFFFQNIISIIGTVWLPTLLFLALAAGCVAAIVPHAWLSGNFVLPDDPQAFFRDRIVVIAIAVPLLAFAGLVIGAMVRVGILRLALGQTQGVTLIWFSLGSQVWRMVASVFLFLFAWIALEFTGIVVIGAVSAGFAALNASPLVSSLGTAVLILAILLGAFYIMLRLFFFLPAVIVAENRIGVSRAWALGQGNVLRILVVILAVVIPIYMIAGFALYAAVIPVVLGAAMHMAPTEDAAANAAAGIAFLKSLLPLLPAFLIIELVAGIVLFGTLWGAIGKAYQAVTQEGESCGLAG